MIHLAAFVLMMTVFKMNVYALVGGNIVFALAMSILNLIKIRKVSGSGWICSARLASHLRLQQLWVSLHMVCSDYLTCLWEEELFLSWSL